MSPTIQSLGIDRLSAADRLRLISEIWESLEKEMEAAPLTEAQRREVDRRLANHESNPEAAIPWEVVEAQISERVRRREA